MSKFAPPSESFIDSQNIKYCQYSDIDATSTPIPQVPLPTILKKQISTKFNLVPDQLFIDEQRVRYSQYANIYATRNPRPTREEPTPTTTTGTAAKGVGDSSNYTSYNIAQLQTAYKYNGIQNQQFNVKPIIAIVMFNSYTKLQSDFDLFCQANNLPPYTLNIIPIDNPPNDNDAGAEQCIDTQMAYGMCPNADIIVVQSKSSSIQDLATAIQVANTYNPHVINMSWGTSEFDTETDVNPEDLFKGNTLYIASTGDTNVLQWPSVSPNVLAVGATTLYTNTDGSISSQSAWSGTGCGPSEFFTMPKYQSEYTDSMSISRNTVDLSAVGNPDTGVQIYYNGKMAVYGGTSVSAPLVAGLMGIANGIRLNNGQDVITSSSTSNLGVQNILYSNYASNGSQLFYDVVTGTSGEYSATIGWDIPTGLGTPYGEECVNFLVNYSSTASESGISGSADAIGPTGYISGSADATGPTGYISGSADAIGTTGYISGSADAIGPAGYISGSADAIGTTGYISNLSNNISKSAISSINTQLSTQLQSSIQLSLTEQVFVWVVNNKTSASDLIAFLQENGFKDIKVDSKDTTITALAEGLVNNTTTSESANAASSCNVTGSGPVTSCTGLDTTAYSNNGNGGSQCSLSFTESSDGSSFIQRVVSGSECVEGCTQDLE